MNIEQLKKINETSRELKKHGIVTSMDEGSRMADQIMGGGLPSAEQTVQYKIQKQVTQEHPEVGIMAASPSQDVLVERVMRKISYEMQEIKGQINALSQRIQQLELTPRARPAGAPMQEAKKPEVKDPNAPKLRADPENFDLKEVAVENIFYYGNKR